MKSEMNYVCIYASVDDCNKFLMDGVVVLGSIDWDPTRTGGFGETAPVRELTNLRINGLCILLPKGS